MAQLRKDSKLCDVTLSAADEVFSAHRVVLAGSCPYFQAMFTGDMEESRATTITLHNISPLALALVLDYCYTASITITLENVQEVLSAADILQLTWVRQLCCEFMQHQLDTTNCLGICALADTYRCPELQKAAGSFAQQHYLEVLEGGEFMDLGPTELADLLQSEDLNVQSEEQVFESVMKWVGHDVEGRRQHLATVLQYVRLPLLDRSYLVSRVGMEPLIRSSEQCRDLVDEAKDYLLLPEQRSLLQGPRTTPRRPIQSNEVMFAVGGWCSGDAISLVERYNPHSDEWKVVATMSKRRCGVGVVVLGDFLYAVGGHDGSSYLNSVERYDPKTNQWTSNLAPTPSCRTSIGVGVLNGFIYTIGGQDGVSCLNLVECYDPGNDVWKSVTPMNSRRLGVGVAITGGCLYAVGGSDGTVPLASVERFDPVNGQWSAVAPLLSKRKHLGVAVHHNMIYAVGGRDQHTELNSVERYDPSTNTWSVVVAMNTRRSGVGLCVMEDTLHAVGGFDGCTYLKSVEWFDAKNNQWKMATSMNYRRLGCGVGKLKVTNSAPL